MLPALLFIRGDDGAALDSHVFDTRCRIAGAMFFLVSLQDPGYSLFTVLPLFRVIFLRDVLSNSSYFICVLWA